MTGIILQKEKMADDVKKKKKRLRGLLIDFWKQSQGNRNVNVVMHKESTQQHPKPKF